MTAVAKQGLPSQAGSVNHSIAGPKRCWAHLLFHWRFLVSWIIFGLLAYSAAYSEIERNHPPVPSRTVSSVAAPTSTTAASERSATKSRRRKGRPQADASRKTSPAAVTAAPEWTPRSVWWISKIALLWGYIGWSLWWAMPATFGIIASGLKRATDSWLFLTFGMPIIAGALLASFVAGVFYSLLGGGIFHAGRCWWRLCQQSGGSQAAPVPATSVAPSGADQVRDQLDRLDTLLRQALISQEEYTRRRKEIIDAATR